MGPIEARRKLEAVIDSKLVFEKVVNNPNDPPRRIEVDRFRLTFMRSYTGRLDFEEFLKQINPDLQFAKDQFDLQMRYKVVKKPGLREYLKIKAQGWEAADFRRGTMIVAYELPKGKQRWQASHSIYLPANNDEVILSEHGKGLRARIDNANPFSDTGIVLSGQEIATVSNLILRASSYDPQDRVSHRVFRLG